MSGPSRGRIQICRRKEQENTWNKNDKNCVYDFVGLFLGMLCAVLEKKNLTSFLVRKKVPFLLVRLCRDQRRAFQDSLVNVFNMASSPSSSLYKNMKSSSCFLFSSLFRRLIAPRKSFFSSSSSGTARSLLYPVMGVCGTCSCAIYSILLSHCWFSTFSFNRNDQLQSLSSPEPMFFSSLSIQACLYQGGPEQKKKMFYISSNLVREEVRQ